MTLVEIQHRLALEQLRRAGEEPVSLAAPRVAGLDSPAVVISELELNGYAIERVYEHGRLAGLRLIEPKDADTGTRGGRRWWSRRHRYRAAPGGASAAKRLKEQEREMSTGQEPHAHVGDWIETRGVHGKPSRRGEIIELLGSGDHEHYRVRWDEQHESIVYPADGVIVLPRDRGAAGGGA